MKYIGQSGSGGLIGRATYCIDITVGGGIGLGQVVGEEEGEGHRVIIDIMSHLRGCMAHKDCLGHQLYILRAGI